MRLVILAVVLLLSLAARAADPSVATFICGDVSDASQHQQCIDKADVVTREQRQTMSTPAWFSFIFPVGWSMIYYGLAFIVGLYVYRDAKQRSWLFLGIRPAWWLILVLFEPPLGLIAYWATHYSRLAQNYAEATTSEHSEK